MPRAALSEHEISTFRERICSAASRLFAEQGYQAVTLRAIAAELGCSPMTPYRYFKDRDEIFASVRAASFRHFAESLEAAVDGIDGPGQRLRALGDAYVAFALSDPDAYRIMFELHQNTASQPPELVRDGSRAWVPIRDGVQRAVAAGLLAGDPDTLAHLFWAGMHGIVSLELAGKLMLGRDLRELVDPMMKVLLNERVAPDAAKEVL